jgi:hypothetical protein
MNDNDILEFVRELNERLHYETEDQDRVFGWFTLTPTIDPAVTIGFCANIWWDDTEGPGDAEEWDMRLVRKHMVSEIRGMAKALADMADETERGCPL